MLLLPPLAPPLCTVVAVPYSIHCRINQQTVITALCNGYERSDQEMGGGVVAGCDRDELNQ